VWANPSEITSWFSFPSKYVRFRSWSLLPIFALFLFGNLQISAQKNLGALDDGVSTQDFLSLYRQLPQGIDGSPQAILKSCQPLDHLRRRRLRPNHFVEFDFAWSRFHLLRNRRLI
jgi:hypothetical protein